MQAALVHRGPDAGGIETWENVGLVHRRLAVVDPSPAGAQPITSPDGRWTMTYNGEVYNHQELREQLPNGWIGHSDSETVVRALDRWGSAALTRFNGQLALAAIDRGSRRLLLARDRFGKKPLYLARDDRGIWFASEIRALFAAGLRPGLNVRELAHTTFLGWLPGAVTPLEGIERVPAGSLRWIALDSLAEAAETWFDPVDLVDPDLGLSLAAKRPRELADELEQALDQAVSRRLMSDTPVGTLLSGGIDSSLVTAIAAEHQPGLVAFTASLPFGRRVNEAGHAERAARAAGVQLEPVEVGLDRLTAELVNAVSAHEYPLVSGMVIAIGAVAARARELGFKVLLTGEASDELFAGYDHRHVPQTRRFLPMPVVAARGAVSVAQHRRPAFISLLRRSGLAPRPDPGPVPAPSAARVRREAVRRGLAAYGSHPGPRGELEAELVADLPASGLGHLLNRMDKNAMASSIETRVPFLDPDVVRLALNMPLEQRAGRRPKRIVRAVARRRLPGRIAARPKQVSMESPLGRRIEQQARPGFLSDGVLRERLGIPGVRWRELTGQQLRANAIRPWSAEIWSRLFLEGASVEQVNADLWR